MPSDALERGGDRGEARRAGVELAGDGADALEVVAAPFEPCEFGGEIPDRPARRPHRAGEPGRAVAAILERELRQDAGAHQRRLAGAGDAVDQHQPALGEAADDLVDHPLPAEEDRPFVLLERTQPGIGPLGQRDRDRRGGGQGAAARGRAARGVEPRAEPSAPVGLIDVETLDAELRDVDRQALAGLVEHRAGQRRGAGARHFLALVDADADKIADKAARVARRAAT